MPEAIPQHNVAIINSDFVNALERRLDILTQGQTLLHYEQAVDLTLAGGATVVPTKPKFSLTGLGGIPLENPTHTQTLLLKATVIAYSSTASNTQIEAQFRSGGTPITSSKCTEFLIGNNIGTTPRYTTIDLCSFIRFVDISVYNEYDITFTNTGTTDLVIKSAVMWGVLA